MKKESKKRWITYVCASLALAMGMSVIAPSIGAYAAGKEQMQISAKEKAEYQPSYDELKELGLTDEEINELKNIKDTGITLENGVAYKDGKVLKDGSYELFGKLSWAVKILKKVYKKLPKKVKNFVGVVGFSKLLNFIDTYTGKIEDAIYNGCRSIGLGKTASWFVTKTLLLFL